VKPRLIALAALALAAALGDVRHPLADVLLFAKDFSSTWPTPFVFAEPIVLRRGATLSATAYGSAAGPADLRLIVSTAAVDASPAR